MENKCPQCGDHTEEVKYEGSDRPHFSQCMKCGHRFSTEKVSKSIKVAVSKVSHQKT